MKKIFILAILVLCSCTMYMPKSIRAANIVTRYLDSIYKPRKIKSMRFGELTTIDSSYLVKNTTDNTPDSVWKKMPDSVKRRIQKDIKRMNKNEEGYLIICVYKIDTTHFTRFFKLDTALTKVTYMDTIDGKSLEK